MAESDNKKDSTNVIDFTEAKLKQLAKHYSSIDKSTIATQIEDCLAAYTSGDISVVWKDGMPYIKFKEPAEPEKSL
jgi:hypothetical protein